MESRQASNRGYLNTWWRWRHDVAQTSCRAALCTDTASDTSGSNEEKEKSSECLGSNSCFATGDDSLDYCKLESNTSYHTSPHLTWAEKLREIFRLIGPGWLVAMAYLDPGNLEGDLITGALRNPNDPKAGYRLLWVLLWATLMGYALQRLAIKLGTATNKDLATLCYLEFPRWMSASIWFLTELCLVGADVQAVIGSAIGLKLLFGVPLAFGIVITLLDTFVVLLIDCCGTRKLEGCFAFMISLMAMCFFINMFTSKPSLSSIVEGLVVVSIPKGTLPFAIALIGSVIMPHNFFLQSAVVQSRVINRTDKAQVERVCNVYCFETFVLLMVSLCVNVAVVVAFANPSLGSPDGSNLNLYNAHTALQSAIGKHSGLVWGLGLLAAGQCSTMACTYAGQFVMEGLLGLRIQKLWLRVLVTRLTSIVPLMFLVLLERGTVEVIANCVNVMQAFNLPFILVLLLKFTTSERVMGSMVLSMPSKLAGYLSGFFLITANVNLVVTQLGGASPIVCIVLFCYFTALGFLWWRPVAEKCAERFCWDCPMRTIDPEALLGHR